VKLGPLFANHLRLIPQRGGTGDSDYPCLGANGSFGVCSVDSIYERVADMTELKPKLDVIRNAVALACRAPSLHNSQPWRWIADGPTLHLFADTARLMFSADPQGREITLSCGAALDHLIVAMSAAGWETTVARFPDPYDPLHLATMDFRPAADDSRVGPVRADAIMRRRTDRRPFGPPDNWVRFEAQLRQALIPYHVMCDVVLDDARARLAEASRLTEQIRAGDPAYESELRWWTPSFATNEGVPQSSLVSATEAAHVDVSRHFPATARGQRRNDDSADQSKIVVLSTHHEDARLDVLRCGEALSALLLECTVAGLATCTLTHMTELASSREIIRGLTGQRGLPQLLVRVGQAPVEDRAGFTATPRRPLSDVLEFLR
jgi:nitroreductase